MNRDLSAWNDEMYIRHPTPYGRGLAGIIQNARVAAVIRLADIRAVDAVLEIGCESGHLIVQIPRCRRRVGVDISVRALDDARALAAERRQSDIVFQQADAQEPLPFEPGDFDVIVCSEVLEHVPHPRRVVDNIHALSTAATRVVVTVPIEGPKIAVKGLLTRLGVFRALFPNIEPGMSEWHLHRYSRKVLLEVIQGLFTLKAARNVWGCHWAALLAWMDPSQGTCKEGPAQ